MAELRALLLTDVVDSTMLSERLGDHAMAGVWTAHDRVARDLLPVWRGREIDKTDGMLMLFEQVGDALGFATAYHRALATLPVPLRARAGLHVGAVILRANPPEDVARGAKPLEVEGIAKPIAARVMSLALGGQTLLTADARAALGDADLRVQSHGFWRIKGIAEPVELFEAGDEHAPFMPPPDSAKVYRVVQQDGLWLPVRDVANNLPAERDAFVGRHDALLELARRFDTGARLVSLLGIGGTGKTRLALRFARTWLGDYPGGAWFCDLSHALSLDGLLHAVALGLDVPLGEDDPVVQLGHAIAGRGRCLVILDNFEHLTRHAAGTLGRWLGASVEASFLVTTREVLGLPGEEVLALPPLKPNDAVELFMKRAASARHGFEAATQEQPLIEQLAGLLDGLPLAIELAAARVRVLSVAALLSRMDQRFKLLAATGGRQDRQATLRATFDWSWDLLGDAEKSALAQMSMFEGGFTLQAAEAVLDLSACDPVPWVIDLIQSLVDKSFVRTVAADRFDLLSSVQAYAAGHLAAEGSFQGSGAAAQRQAQARHGAWFAALGPQRAVDAGCADLPNLVAACRWAIREAHAQRAVGALQGAWAALSRHGPFSSGAELAAAVCGLTGLDDAAAARAHAVQGSALEFLGHSAQARRHYEIALVHARAWGDLPCQADLMIQLADLDGSDSRMVQARDGLTKALELARQLGNGVTECAALNGLANVAIDQGRIDEARASYEAGLARAREVEDRSWQCSLLGNLGMLHANVGRMDEARACLEQALALARALGDRRREGALLCNLGMLHLVQRRLDEAIDVSQQALRVAREVGHRRVQGIVSCNLGLAAEEQGRTAEALAHFDDGLKAMRDLGDRRHEGQFLGYVGRTRARQGDYALARECFAEGHALLSEVSDALSLGILLCDLATCEWHAGDAEAARRALDEARAMGVATGAGPDSELGQALARAQALLGQWQDVPPT